MAYQPGAVVHGVTHIADVFKAGNVYVNNVKVAISGSASSNEGFAFSMSSSAPPVPDDIPPDDLNDIKE
jgi:hypothetical protein